MTLEEAARIFQEVSTIYATISLRCTQAHNKEITLAKLMEEVNKLTKIASEMAAVFKQTAHETVVDIQKRALLN